MGVEQRSSCRFERCQTFVIKESTLPELTAEEKKKLSPMMKEYLKTREETPGCILFYRLGDFYEMFFDDALTVAKELELTLTGKNCGLDERAPMCGVPFHALDRYLEQLVEKGYRVAICDQVEDPKESKGLVKRAVTRIVTPGTNITSTSMDESKNCYISCIFAGKNMKFGLSSCDVSTGDFSVTEFSELVLCITSILSSIN